MAKTDSTPNQHSAAYANLTEITQSDPLFREIDNEPYLSDEPKSDEEVAFHQAARNAAKDIIFDTLATSPRMPESEQLWNMAYASAVKGMSDTALGAFSRYFDAVDAEGRESRFNINELPEGDYKVVRTNNRVLDLRHTHEKPLDFLVASADLIDAAKENNELSVGPENYATALKFFVDKYSDLENPAEEIKVDDYKQLVNTILEGFVEAAAVDEPNIVEMTNIYASIRTLPKDVVDAKFTKPLVDHTLVLLPKFDQRSLNALLGAVSKLEINDDDENVARVVNLAIRKGKKFDTTDDYRIALRAIEVLPKSTASENAFRAFMKYRNDLELTLDLHGADESMHRLRSIAENVIDDQTLTLELKQMAERMGQRIGQKCKRLLLEGGLTDRQQKEIKRTFSRILENYRAI